MKMLSQYDLTVLRINNWTILSVFVLVLIVLCHSGYGQQGKGNNPITNRTNKTTSCEENIALLEASHRRVGENGFLILIGRMGVNESTPEVNRLRLHNAVAYLSDYTKLRERSTIIVAEGKKDLTQKQGIIEIYVHGQLFGNLLVKEGSYLRVGSCEPYEIETSEQRKKRQLFYPQIDKRKALIGW